MIIAVFMTTVVRLYPCEGRLLAVAYTLHIVLGQSVEERLRGHNSMHCFGREAVGRGHIIRTGLW